MLDELKTSKNSLQKLYTVTKKAYFYPVTNKHSMNRMNLAQLVAFFANKNFSCTASFFAGCANDSVTVDGLIEANFVKKHLNAGYIWRRVQANVTTYIDCDMKFRVSDRNDVGIWGEVYDSNGKYVNSMNIPYKEWTSKYGIPFHEAYLRTFDLK